jgi:hypothetical protein
MQKLAVSVETTDSITYNTVASEKPGKLKS